MHSLYGWSNLKKQILFYKVVFALAQDRPQAPHATRNLFRCSCLLQRKHSVQINLDRGLFEAPRIRVTPINYVQRFRICPLLLLSVLTTETTTPPLHKSDLQLHLLWRQISALERQGVHSPAACASEDAMVRTACTALGRTACTAERTAGQQKVP